MIKRYINLFSFIKDMPNLKNYIVIFPHSIEEQFSMLTSMQSQKIKNDMKRLNIKIIVEREIKYENNKFNKKAI